MNRNFIMHLLDGRELPEQDLLDFEKALGWTASEGAYLVLIENHPHDSFAGRALPYTISTRLPFSFPFNYNDSIVCLLSDNDFKLGCKIIRDLLAPIGFSGGVSLPFASWDSIPTAYLQAKIALAHKDMSDESLLLCNDYLWDCYIERFSGSGCAQLRSPAIEALQRNSSGSTQLVDTLYCYLRNNCALATTAEALGIHINTLKYRMGRIRDITGFDTDDYESRMTFLVSYDAEHRHKI